MTKWVFSFGNGDAEGSAALVADLGDKGAGLADMARLGLPVPPGFTLVSDASSQMLDGGGSNDLRAQVDEAIEALAGATGRRFGHPQRPLLLAIRAGARVPMPGVMDSILNVGLNDRTVEGLADLAGRQFAFDTYRRFIPMFAEIVFDLDPSRFEQAYDALRDVRGDDLCEDDLRSLTDTYKALVLEECGSPFPEEPGEQLWAAIRAVVHSWQSPSARAYRALHHIGEGSGTAVNIQSMVFGNLGGRSGTGIAWTRDGASGRRGLCGEFLANAQGDDVLDVRRRPAPLTIGAGIAAGVDGPSFEQILPDAYAELGRACERLERHYGDMQQVEFTVEDGRLWMLQTRSGRRSAAAAIRIAVEMALEGLISRDAALMRIEPGLLDQLLHRTIDPAMSREILATGLPAAPGAASGEIVFSAEAAAAARAEGRRVILVRAETSPEDVEGMHAAEAVLTSRGGLTSHAAMVARGMGKPCISGASTIRIDERRQTMIAGGRVLKNGAWITVDGSTGEVLLGAIPLRQPELSPEFAQLMKWADARRQLGVRANAETPEDAEAAIRFGAEGIGLCRSEQMFFAEDRRATMLEMILAETDEDRRRALDRLLPMQRQDYLALFRIMRGKPVTIRLLDPPLHEFLPRRDAEIAAVAEAMGMDPDHLRSRIDGLSEFNPMLGHRGVRLAITYPAIAEMQIRAILEAALDAEAATGTPVQTEIMVPLVLDRSELDVVRRLIDGVADAVRRERGKAPSFALGTMIELPRAALRAASIAEVAEFFSFGTNDLTQTTLGISRDDSAAFLGKYTKAGILSRDPFVTIDREGVGELIQIAVERGRSSRPALQLGACGEHGGDPESIAFFADAGLDYVSSSPYRVPIARLAAAQAAIQSGGKKKTG